MKCRHSEALDRLNNLIDQEWERRAEIAVKLDVVTESGWAGELRYTAEPNQPDGPDRSVVFYAASGCCPDDVIARLVGSLERELSPSTQKGALAPDESETRAPSPESP